MKTVENERHQLLYYWKCTCAKTIAKCGTRQKRAIYEHAYVLILADHNFIVVFEGNMMLLNEAHNGTQDRQELIWVGTREMFCKHLDCRACCRRCLPCVRVCGVTASKPGCPSKVWPGSDGGTWVPCLEVDLHVAQMAIEHIKHSQTNNRAPNEAARPTGASIQTWRRR